MPNIHHAVLIGAEPGKVYQAITSQEGLAGWWTPKALTSGELHSIARFPFGDDYFKEMRITRLKPFELVEWNCVTGAEEWVGTTITFNLTSGDTKSFAGSHPEIGGQIEQQEKDQGTLLIFRHEAWKNETLMFAECNYTWAQFLRSLKHLCETGQGHPWPHQHRISIPQAGKNFKIS